MKNVVKFPERSTIEAEAAEWLVRLDGERPPDAGERARLRAWLARSPAHRAELESLAKLWGRLNVLTELAVPLGGARPARREHARTGAGHGRKLAFASLAAAALVSLAFLLQMRTPDTEANGYYSTAVGEQRRTPLPDGSSILLNTNSQVKVEYRRDNRDVVLLQGEAHFAVAPDGARPFRVYAGNGRVEAVGTAFVVRLRDDAVDVTVTEGSVALASVDHSVPADIDRSLPLPAGAVPNDRYATNLGTVSAGQVGFIGGSARPAAGHARPVKTITVPELDRRLSWRSGTLTFSGETLEEVIGEFGRYTTTRIVIDDDPEIRSLRIGGRFPVSEPGAMFAALEANFGLRVERVGRNRVLISASD